MISRAKISSFCYLSLLLILLSCSTRLGQQLQQYRSLYKKRDFSKAQESLKESQLDKDPKNLLLWYLENGTVALARNQLNEAISFFEKSLAKIDQLYTIKISSKTASFLINDKEDDFYGASFERSYAHYFLAKSYYLRFIKSQKKEDLLKARSVILAWDSYFSSLQRSADKNVLYSTDLVLKIFGAQIHELTTLKNDRQISLQLYEDALRLLKTYGGIFSGFNSRYKDFVHHYQKYQKASLKLYQPTIFYDELYHFLTYKILSLTRKIRPSSFQAQLKKLKPAKKVLSRLEGKAANTVLLFEEGLISKKIPRTFNFGLKQAFRSTKNPGVKNFIAQVGTELVASFALTILGLRPQKIPSGATQGDVILSSTINKVSAFEASVQFELPAIEKSKSPSVLQFFILNEKKEEVKSGDLPVISFNNQIAKTVLEEDALKRYVRTGLRVASKHVAAIVLAMQVYRGLNKSNGPNVWAKSAALATYVGASKGIAALEKADTRQWSTLPARLRMTEFYLPPGTYQFGIRKIDKKSQKKTDKMIGAFEVRTEQKRIHSFRLLN